MKRIIPCVVVGILMLAGAASAQVVTGIIIGAVKDESQAVLPGVTATITSSALPGGPLTVVTGNEGEYRFVTLPPGVYTLTMTLPGFATYEELDLRVTLGGTLERNVTLRVSAVLETVTVSGESPMIDPRQVAVEHTVPPEFVENVQHQRYSIQEFAKWTPGVSAGDPSGRSQAVNVMGSPSGESTWLLDGIQLKTQGGINPATDPDLVQEITVSTLGASAEYAIMQGGVFNAVGKSGTNRFVGSASTVFQPDALISQPIKLPCATCPGGESGFSRSRHRDFSVHAGGPIITDRLWYFGGFAIWERAETAPGIDDSFLSGFDQDNKVGGKVNWKINDRWGFSGTFMDEAFNTPARASLTTPVSTLTEQQGHPGILTWGSEAVGQLSNKTILTLRMGGVANNSYTQPKTGDIITPRRLDAATGISRGGVAQMAAQHSLRQTAAAKLIRFVSRDGFDQELRGGVQYDWNRIYTFTAFPSGVQYSDLNGAPDLATFRDAFADGGKYKWWGAWAEDQVTIGNRLTLNLGIRWDRMQAISQDIPAVNDQLERTGGTLSGLGNLYRWTVVSPRVGFNLKIGNDGKTVLRGNYNRGYSGVLLSELRPVHPGQSPITLKRFNPATGDYTTTVSVTDPLANIAVDPNTKAPWVDQYSLGLDRQLAGSMAVSVSYVHKYGENQLGWVDAGGVYGTRDDVLPNGQTITVFPLLNSPSARRFLRTNGPGFFTRYNGLLMTVSKRMTKNWGADVSYTLSTSEGLMPTGNTGQDPNDYINLAGRVTNIDRPRMLQSQAIFNVPRVGVMVSASVMIVAGFPYMPQALVQLPQGRRSINIAPPGGKDGEEFRAPRQDLISLRISKIMALGGSRQLELMGNLNNALQSQAYQQYVTLNFFNADFAKPNAWIEPRNLNLMLKVRW